MLALGLDHHTDIVAEATFVAVCLANAGVIGCGFSLHCATAAQLAHVHVFVALSACKLQELVIGHNGMQPHAVCLMSLPG